MSWRGGSINISDFAAIAGGDDDKVEVHYMCAENNTRW
jgi:hypothetical protein